MEVVKDHGDEALYDKLDSAYSTDDDTEVYIIYCLFSRTANFSLK